MGDKMNSRIKRFRFDLFSLFACLGSPIILLLAIFLSIKSEIIVFSISTFSLILIVLSWISAFVDMIFSQNNPILSKIILVVSIIIGAWVFLCFAMEYRFFILGYETI